MTCRVDTSNAERPGVDANNVGVLKLEHHTAKFCCIRATCYAELKADDGAVLKSEGLNGTSLKGTSHTIC